MHMEPNRAPGRRILVLMGNDRLDDGVLQLARAALRGAIAADCYVNLRFLPEIIPDMLARCGHCDGASPCRIRDGLYHLLGNEMMQADGIVLCSRLYWHSYSKCMEAFIERSLCYKKYHHTPILFGQRRGPKPMAMSLLLEHTSATCLNGIDVRMMDYARQMGGYMSKILVSNVAGSELGVEHDHRASLLAVEKMARDLLFTDPREFDMEYIDCPPKGHDSRYAFGAWGSLSSIH
ncbi:flavodoxin family protein [Isoalcanivorax indicus]|uniref:flavodoxin family protein n=1 Tax=Isoalcanivorax indicus TaxID=2202653 RepID=UPI000DB92B05|nr:NAD(P)H-dependent oxidoreductase [Isoalcanivorax indicus]